MNLLHKRYELLSPLESQAAVKQVALLLSQESVAHIATGLRVASTSTPLVVLGIQPQLYTRKNWFGLNPFAFVTSVDICCEPIGSGGTRVAIDVNRRRAIFHVTFWTVCAALTARAFPGLVAVGFVAAIVLVAGFSIVSFLGGHLIRREIAAAIDATG